MSALGVIDARNPNVVVALTHATNILRKPSDVSKMEEKKKLILDAAQTHLGFRPTIAIIENDLEHVEKVEGTDWTVLPDGTCQPLNLYQAIVAMLERNGDELAVASISCLFKNAVKIEPKKGLQVAAKVAEDDDVTLDELETHFRNLVNIDHLTSAKKTEVWQKIIVQNKVGADRRDQYELLCLNLINNGFKKSEDFRGLSLGEVAGRLRPYVLSREDEETLSKTFSLKKKVGWPQLAMVFRKHKI